MRIEDLMAPVTPDPKAASAEPNQTPPGMTQATPEEQEAYEKVVLAGMKVMYDDKTRERALAMLKGQRDQPAQGLARVAQMIILKIDESSQGTIPEAVILPAAAEILEHLSELAQEARILKVDQNVLGKAGQLMVLGLAEAYGVAPEDVQSLLDSLPPEQVQQMVEEQASYDRAEIGSQAEPGDAPAPDDEADAEDMGEDMPEAPEDDGEEEGPKRGNAR